jgi:hypothetical protein
LLAEEACEHAAGFWLEGADDAREGDIGAGGGSPSPSSNAANGPAWSVDCVDAALLRAPWLRLAWRTALTSDTTPDTSYLFKRVDPRTALPISLQMRLLAVRTLQSAGHAGGKNETVIRQRLGVISRVC